MATCPECKGRGTLLKLWPKYALSMPHELAWQRFPCWRCKGAGVLPADDPYVVKPLKLVAVVVLWWWLMAGGTAFIMLLLWR